MRAFLLLALAIQLPLQEAVTLVREGHFQQAEQKLKGQAEPQDLKQRIAYHRLRAAIASGLHRLPEAAAEMRQALALAPDDDDLRTATGFALIESGTSEEAIAVLKSGKESAIDLTLLGIAHYAQGEFKDAEGLLNRAIQQNAKFEPAYRSLAQLVLGSSSTPSNETIRSLCGWDEVVCSALELRVARESSDREEQSRAMATLKAAPPENRVARCALGQAYQWTNEWLQARRELESCVTMDPSPRNHYRLAMVYQHLGKSALAHRELEARKKLLGQQPEESVTGLTALQDLRKK